MIIKYGFRIELACTRQTPVLAMIDIHPDDLGSSQPAALQARCLASGSPLHELRRYHDAYGNICTWFVAPEGGIVLEADGEFATSGLPEAQNPQACASPPEHLPDQVLVYLLGSRYCDTDIMSDFAWNRFGMIAGGWHQVRAVCDFVHGHLKFDYMQARNTRSASQGFSEQVGVCRDFAHLAITLCRCLNIPARYCTGYLGDIGVPVDPNPMDFSAWFEVYLDGKWWTFDARHNVPRIGRIVMARGRDATDVPILHSFGPHVLQRFEVTTHEVLVDALVAPASLANHQMQQGQPQAG